MKITKVIEEINNLSKNKKNILLAIDGKSGSGKTTLAKNLQENLKYVKIIHLDQFDLYENNFEKVIKEVIKPFKQKVDDKQILILEGVFTLSKNLEKFYDYKIWIEIPVSIGFKRGLQRDINLNGIDNSDKWITYWLPKEKEYITNEKPQKKANIILEGSV